MKLGIITGHDRAGLKWVKDLGLEYGEFDVNGDDVKYVTDNIKDIKAAMTEYGVGISAVGRWGRDRLNKDLTVNEKERNDEYDLIDFCEKVGCPVYICGVNYVEGFSYYSNISAAINYIQSLVDYAAGREKICTYNCSWNSYIDKPHEWDIIHGHIKELGIKFDPSHTVNGGRDYMQEAVNYGNRFCHVHLKGTINVDGKRVDDPPAGLDSINWGALLSVLRYHKYAGMLSIEPHSETWQGEIGEKGVRFTIEYFKKLLFIE
jgi:sugar phosphate isomerase/epimerase